MKRGDILAAAALSMALIRCSSTETGNPEATGNLYFALTASNSAIANVGGSTGISLEHAWLSLGPVTLTGCSGLNSTQVVSAPIVLDVAAVNASVALKSNVGRVCALDAAFQTAVNVPALAPPLLEMGTLVLQGKRGDGIPFELQSTEPLMLGTLRSAQGFELGSGPLILTFDVSKWWNGIDLGQADQQGGMIPITHGQNTDILRALEANVPLASDLRLDENSNGKVDPGEHTLALPR